MTIRKRMIVPPGGNQPTAEEFFDDQTGKVIPKEDVSLLAQVIPLAPAAPEEPEEEVPAEDPEEDPEEGDDPGEEDPEDDSESED